MAAKHFLIGKRFSRLRVTREMLELKTDKHRFYKCRCDCGAVTAVAQAHLLSGHTTSCGCRLIEVVGARYRRHGHGGNSTQGVPMSVEYRAWAHMKNRCYNRNDKSYANYGGRGITVCARWLECFDNFIADMGRRPSAKHSLDRINNSGNYEPGNCRWADGRTQRMNSRNAKRAGRHDKRPTARPL